MSRFFVVVCVLLSEFCWPAHAEQPTEQRLRVVASIAPIYCFSANVAGELADVELLLPATSGPHQFALSPSDMKALSTADVVIMNGLELEPWLEQAIESLGNQQPIIIKAGEGIELPEVVSHGADCDHGHDHDHSHEHHHHGAVNPHIWLDPMIAIKQVENIADGLAQADAANADDYRKNAAAYKATLEELDRVVRQQLAGLKDRRIITFHDAFPYFAKRYQIEVAGVFQLAPGRDPGPKRLGELREQISTQGVKAIFAEPQYSPKLLESMAADLKVPVGVLDPMGTGKAATDFYRKVTLANVAALVKALGNGQ